MVKLGEILKKSLALYTENYGMLYLFILHLQSSGHVVTEYNSKLDTSFMRRAPACIIIHFDCKFASGYGCTDCG